MSGQGIEWITGVDKTAIDLGNSFRDHALRLASMELPLQLDECAIGIVHPLGQDRTDVNACELVLCKKRLAGDVKLGGL
jgi:hypothetical protein